MSTAEQRTARKRSSAGVIGRAIERSHTEERARSDERLQRAVECAFAAGVEAGLRLAIEDDPEVTT